MAGAADTEAILHRYLEELYAWNRRINLTTVPADDAERRHLGEARRLLETAGPQPGARVADIGSGSGVPGLVLAILRPDLEVTLIESDRRRAGFLVHAAAICACRRTAVLARRAEEVGHDPAHRAGYDLAVSRATAAAPALCELALPLLRVGGRLLALVTDAAADAEHAAAAARSCGGSPPSQAAPGVLSVVKIAPTPERFPRRPGVPARRPLLG
ncbi:MAG TPA: 16S rRNA (guanine(527)-N(7))-methyltransferase RsmG [Candidatus Binatia bacterium]|nr:16S rRNA (guanine(527)-N(7))-methyltransferase RsmG [Candidatus Binatia bacterium]